MVFQRIWDFHKTYPSLCRGRQINWSCLQVCFAFGVNTASQLLYNRYNPSVEVALHSERNKISQVLAFSVFFTFCFLRFMRIFYLTLYWVFRKPPLVENLSLLFQRTQRRKLEVGYMLRCGSPCGVRLCHSTWTVTELGMAFLKETGVVLEPYVNQSTMGSDQSQ